MVQLKLAVGLPITGVDKVNILDKDTNQGYSPHQRWQPENS